MMIKKYNKLKNIYCLGLASLFIVSGCAHENKKEQVIGIQKVRIKKLEQQLQRKNKVIDRLKVQKWTNTPVVIPESKALQPLQVKIKKKQWVSALRLSGKLKKQYPHSVTLAKYRILIFRKMGLKKQALREVKTIKAHLNKQMRKSRKQ